MRKRSSPARAAERAALAGAAVIFLVLPSATALAATDYPVSTGADGACDFTANTTVDTNAHPVWNCTTLTVAAGVTVDVSGSHSAEFLATGPVTIAGTLAIAPGTGSADVGAGTPGAAGAGGNGGAGGAIGAGGSGGLAGGGGGGGPAGGGGGGGLGSSDTGGAGGGSGGAGGAAFGGGGGAVADAQAGGNTAPESGASGGGGAFGTAGFHVGSGGGAGGGVDIAAFADGGAGGAGGGALRIVTPDAITLGPAATVIANGGNGNPGLLDFMLPVHGGSGGGGSGGAILFVAPTVDIAAGATVHAFGGTGATTGGGASIGGNGGIGWIGVVANSVADAASGVSPTPATSLYSAALAVALAGAGSGTVTSSPAGIDCGADCTEDYDGGATVTLTAAPSPGSVFTGWSGGCTVSAADCTVQMATAQSVTATFALAPTTTTTPPPTAACEVPRVVGLGVSKARARIARAHCTVGRVRRKHSSRKRKGKVLAQSPKPGTRLRVGGKVALTVGRGPK